MKRTNQLKVLLTDEEMLQLKRYSDEVGVSMSDAIRAAMLTHCVPGTAQVRDSVPGLTGDVKMTDWYQELQGMMLEVAQANNQKLPKLERELVQLTNTVERHADVIAQIRKHIGV